MSDVAYCTDSGNGLTPEIDTVNTAKVLPLFPSTTDASLIEKLIMFKSAAVAARSVLPSRLSTAALPPPHIRPRLPPSQPNHRPASPIQRLTSRKPRIDAAPVVPSTIPPPASL